MTGNRIYNANLGSFEWQDILCYRGEKRSSKTRKAFAKRAKRRERTLLKKFLMSYK